MRKDFDKVLGCLIGGAAGDALGYPVEFSSWAEIQREYGENGIQHYELNGDGVAEISDDTQMTIFTANGLIFWSTRGHTHGVAGYPDFYIKFAYNDWLRTQKGERCSNTWVGKDPRLHARRAPGMTCLSALEAVARGLEVRNDSKGCGGVMRVAPIALFADIDHLGEPMLPHQCAAEVAAITHKHPLGFLTAAYLEALLEVLQKEKCDSAAEFEAAMAKAWEVFQRSNDEKSAYGNLYPGECREMSEIISKAVRLAKGEMGDVEAIHEIGGGWVAEETLAIALFSCLRHFGDFACTIRSAVNHSGDSDSTGSVAGQIMGLILGASRIPDAFKTNLELLDLLETLAHDLVQGCPIDEYGVAIEGLPSHEYRTWHLKYLDHQPASAGTISPSW